MRRQGWHPRVYLSWFIGLAIVVAVCGWVAYRMFTTDCPAPGVAEGIVVVVLPLVYLALMYLTLRRPE